MHGMEIMQLAVRGSALVRNEECSERARASMARAESVCVDGRARVEQGEAARRRAFTIFLCPCKRGFSAICELGILEPWGRPTLSVRCRYVTGH